MKRCDREHELAIRRVRFEQALENRARIRIALLLDVELREGAGGGTRLRRFGEETVEVADRIFGRALGEDVGLDQYGAFPVGL